MPNTPNPIPDASQDRVYQIRVKGHLGPRWSSWFQDLAITVEDNGDTLLTGPIVDQAELHGLLRRIRDLGIPLISLMRLDAIQVDAIVADRPRAKLRETEAGP
jgi:hypothetical protein